MGVAAIDLPGLAIVGFIVDMAVGGWGVFVLLCISQNSNAKANRTGVTT